METERLRLRRWLPSDAESFASLNADPHVTEFLMGALSREQSDGLIQRIEQHFEADGYGLWAVEVKEGERCIGFIGLKNITFEAHFTPAVEIGWRLAHAHWNRGFATEGAREVLKFARESLRISEVVSMTATENWRSRHVMEKIGLHRDPSDDFDHPLVPEGHPLRPHVLYRTKW